MELALALNLSLEAIEESAFEFHDASTAEAGHVDVIALRSAFIKMLFTLHVHEIELVDEAVTLEEIQSPVHGDAIYVWVETPRVAQDLAGVEMLLGGFDDAEDLAALACETNSTRRQFGL